MEDQSRVSVQSPDGEYGTIPKDQLWAAVKKGYSEVSPEIVASQEHREKYGNVSQQAKAFAEGAGEAASFGLSTKAETSLGVDPEEIQKRREENPVAHGLGQVVGLAGSSLLLPGAGAAGLAERAGVAGAKALVPGAEAVLESAQAVKTSAQALKAAKAAGEGIDTAKIAYESAKAAKEAQPFIAKVGTESANQAIQFAMLQSGDEVSKMFSGAPGYESPGIATETALTNIGLSTLLGGATGAGVVGVVSPLWKATLGQKTENLLNPLLNRANGETAPLAKDLETALGSEVKMAPEIRAGLSDDPVMKEYYQGLIESGTQSGEALRKTRDEFKNQAGEKLKSIFHTGEDLSAFESGEKAKESILAKAEELNSQVRKNYDAVNGDNSSILIPDNARLKFYDKIIEEGQEFGAVGSPAEGLFKNYGERILAQDTVAQQDKLLTEIGSAQNVAYRAGDFEKSRALGQIKESIRDFQDVQIGKATAAVAKGTEGQTQREIEALGRDLVKERQAARKSYADFMETIRDIASVGKLGKVKSFGQFQEALEKIPSAKLAEKLFDKKNIESLNYLKTNYPDVFQSLLNQQKQSIIENSTKAGELAHSSLLTKIDKLPKEVENLMFSKEEQSSIQALGKVLRDANVRMGPSGSPRTLDTLWKHMPAGVLGAVGALTGRGALAGILLGEAGRFLGREAPDAVKLSLLKFLGSTGPVDGQAWKAAADFINHAYKGHKMIEGAAGAVFKSGAEVLARTKYPTPQSTEKLDKRLKKIQEDPSSLLEVGGKTSHYLPEQGQALAKTAASTSNYLNSLRPKNEKASPLDSDLPESKYQKAQFQRALEIADQPLIVLQDVKSGTIVPQDIVHLSTLYPDLYKQLSQQLTNKMIEAVDKKEPIPYKTRFGVSMFIGQPLDSTMTPQAIMALNPPMPVEQAPTGETQSPRHSSMKNINKISAGYLTPSQSREVNKIKS